jgi:undecaprenyl-diphosphatase
LRVVTTLGSGWVLWLVAAPATIALLVVRRYRLAVYLALTCLGPQVLSPTLKALVGRLRPVVPDPVAVEASKSFPSGHALGSFVVYGALLLVLVQLVGTRWRVPAAVATAVLVVAIGFSRVALGVHYVSDVVGAWLIGFVWLGTSLVAAGRWRPTV